jgi:hypothetical protein
VYAVEVRSYFGRTRFGAVLRDRVQGTIALVLIIWLASSAAAAARNPGGDEATLHWKQITEGQIKLDDKPPIGSNLYQQVQKKGKIKDPNLVLVLLGHRYLLLDIKAKTVYQVLPTDLKAQGSDFDSGDLAQDSRIIPTSDWSSRDVGPAQLIGMTLGDYGRTLEIEIPHMPDLRAFY